MNFPCATHLLPPGNYNYTSGGSYINVTSSGMLFLSTHPLEEILYCKITEEPLIFLHAPTPP